MTITRAHIDKFLVPGLNQVLGMSYGEVAGEHSVLFDTDKSSRSFEEMTLMTGLGTAPTKGEGDAVSYDDFQQAWTARFTHSTVALAFAITEEAVEDDLYEGTAKIKAKALGRSMANTKQVRAANIFNNGFNANFPGGDGQPLFSTTHGTVGGSDQSNRVTSQLSETALEQAFIDITLYKDDKDILIGARPKSLHIPPQLQFVATRILEGDYRVGTADNDINALRNMGILQSGAYVNHRFTDPENWFIRTDVPNGTIHFERVALQAKSEGDFDTGNMRYKARERYSFGWADWRQWYGSTPA